MPSGIWQPRSITTRVRRLPRPITVSGRITASVMVQQASTRTLENSTARRMLEPTTMQPPEISTLDVSPFRPCSSGTNFAGGNCSW